MTTLLLADGTALALRAAREGVLLALLLVAPPLLASVLVGLVVGALQAATQLQDVAIGFVPKLVVVGLVLLAMGPALSAQLVRFSVSLWSVLGAVP